MTAVCPVHCHHGVGTWGPAEEGWSRSAKGVTGANLRGELRRRVQEKWQIKSEWLQQSWKGDVSTESEWKLSLIIFFFIELWHIYTPCGANVSPSDPVQVPAKQDATPDKSGWRTQPQIHMKLESKKLDILKWSLPSSPLSCPLGELMAGQCLFNY